MTDPHPPFIPASNEAGPPLRTVTATRYVTPLREGGSLPAIVEADDDGLYVLKFRGAGQGKKALLAELIGGEIGRALGLLVPEIVFVEVDPALGRSEPDWEIQNLIQASVGLNLGLDYLPGALSFDPLLKPPPPPDLASAIVWFDMLITNVDRTPRNVNMLLWHQRLWLIDHGAGLYFHYSWNGYLEKATRPFPAIQQHVLLPFATALREANERLKATLSEEVLRAIVDLAPASWLEEDDAFASPEEQRDAYVRYLTARLAASDSWVEEARDARARLL